MANLYIFPEDTTKNHMTQKAIIDRNLCVGCSVCNSLCPEVFAETKHDPEHNGDFKTFTNDNIDHEQHKDKIDEAIEQCPVRCISWREKTPSP